jgi:hypothetical protein
MKYARATFIAGLALFASQATAQTGTQLFQSCLDKNRGASDVMCIYYVSGFVDGMLLGKVVGDQASGMFCPPTEGISTFQARLIIEKYLINHPEKLHEKAGYLAAEALMDAFQCKKSNSK